MKAQCKCSETPEVCRMDYSSSYKAAQASTDTASGVESNNDYVTDGSLRLWAWLNVMLNPFANVCAMIALAASYLAEIHTKLGEKSVAKSRTRVVLLCNVLAFVSFVVGVVIVVSTTAILQPSKSVSDEKTTTSSELYDASLPPGH